MVDGFGLSNIAADRYAPERLNNILEMERTFDVANERMRVRERRRTNFTFANAGANEGLNRVNQVIDGIQTYTVPSGGGSVFELEFERGLSGEGNYAFVTHAFADASKGAIGVIQVGSPKTMASH